jgi:hypothetical protein
MQEHRAAWSAAWGVVAVVFGAGAAALWVALTTGGSWWFLLPAVVCSVIVAVGLYCMFAVLARQWPFNASDEAPEAHAPDPPPLSVTPAQTQDSSQPIFDEAPPEFADMTPVSLNARFAGRTEAQRRTLMKQHVGKPVRVSGEIEDVTLASSYGGSVRLRGKSGVSFLLYFDAANKEAERQVLIALNTGDRLVVSGVIHEVTTTVVVLDNSKLIRHVS